MNKFLVLAFLFFIGSLVGWGLEVLFRRYFSTSNPNRKWINPGFLIGPYLPLYGFSLCILYCIASQEKYIHISDFWLEKAVLFISMAVCITVIEYVAGIVFIKGMHIKLWDYSDEKFNIQGIICPKFTFYWAILSAIYYFFIHPYILNALYWLSLNLAFSFIIGAFFGVFTIDFAHATNLIVNIRHFAEENDIIVKYEDLKEHIRSTEAELRNKSRFLLSMKSSYPLRESLKQYHEKFWETHIISGRHKSK